MLVPNSECRAILGSCFAPVAEPRRGDVRVVEPFLNFGNIGLMREGIGWSRRAQRVHAKAVHLAADANFEAVFHDDVATTEAGSGACGRARPCGY